MVLASALREGGVYPFFVLRSVSQLNPATAAANVGYAVRMQANNNDPIHKQQCVQLSFSAKDRKNGNADAFFSPYYGAALHVVVVPRKGRVVESNEPKQIQHFFGAASKTEAAQRGCKAATGSLYAGLPRLGPTLAVNVALDEGQYAVIAQMRAFPTTAQTKNDTGDLITAVFDLDVLGAPFVALPVPLIAGGGQAKHNAFLLANGANFVQSRVRFSLDENNLERFFEVDLNSFCASLPGAHSNCDNAIRQFSLDVWLERDTNVFENDQNINLDKIPAWATQSIEMQVK